jgi:hypothetical protein
MKVRMRTVRTLSYLTAIALALPLCIAYLITPLVGAQIAAVQQPRSRTATETQTVGQSPAIEIAAAIPPAPAAMPVYRLTPTSAPVEFLDEKLRATKLPTLRLDKQTYVVRSATGNEDGLRAHIDLRSGDTHFIPNLGELLRRAQTSKPFGAERAANVARTLFADARFIPKDSTELRLADPITVEGSSLKQGAATTVTRTATITIMTLVPAVRYANGFRVYGLGSNAVVTLDNEGTMVGTVRRWRTAARSENIKPVITAAQIRTDIMRQMRPLVASKGTRAVVDKIELAYYDNNKDLLQPVYHFEATVHPPEPRIAPIRVSGFIPIGEAREPIPDLAAPASGERPATPKPPNPNLTRGGIGTAPTPDDITLGEYANQDWPNDGGYVSMSNSFLNGLTFLNSIIPGWTPPVTRTQWYVAYPWEVVGPSSRYYMNAVNVAYTVPHGDWLINSTRSNCCDLWNVGNIGTGGNPGFGHAANNGNLATWVIMSCEVIPSFYDRANEIGGSGNGYDAFNVWWPVFQGLHNAIGFRTIMFYPDNNLNWGFGYAASLGGDINAAWFQEVAAYESGVGTYASQHLNGHPQVHYDRASVMIDGRDLGQSIFSVGPQTASSTLWNFWMNN